MNARRIALTALALAPTFPLLTGCSRQKTDASSVLANSASPVEQSAAPARSTPAAPPQANSADKAVVDAEQKVSLRKPEQAPRMEAGASAAVSAAAPAAGERQYAKQDAAQKQVEVQDVEKSGFRRCVLEYAGTGGGIALLPNPHGSRARRRKIRRLVQRHVRFAGSIALL